MTITAMTIEQLREVCAAQPFVPFVLQLADGRYVDVPHRDFIALGPAGRTVIVYKPDERFHIVDLLLVTDIEVKKGDAKKGNGAKRRKS